MRKRITLWVLTFVFITLAAAPFASASPADGRVKVLFLGDNAGHNPSARARSVTAEMHDRYGIDIVYTPDVESLTADGLAGYDVVLIYANQERISSDQEAALLGFVENGGGLAAIHCASFCFHNSPKYIELVGAQFRSHGTGEFTEKITDTAHPINAGRQPITSWDETYVHSRHNTDRTLLAERVDGDHTEPWTWVRTHGKGRVFYTAWGHDQRTWTNEGFRDLLARGVRWSAGDWAINAKVADPGFETVPARVPNYPPSPRWGVTAEPYQTMQTPMTVEASMKRMVLPSELEARLFAAEPKIIKPLSLTFDARGRLWIAETTDYPNELVEELGAGNDRISIVEDTNADGVADSFKVFADKLSVVTGMVHYRDGVIVASTPRVLFLRDTDGDDKADVREVLIEGWGTNDTHATLSNLRWGPDNWVWGAIGYSGFNGQVGGEQHRFGNGMFRMKPDGSKLEYIRSTNNNTWGIGFSEEGLVMVSTANGVPTWYVPMANRFFESVGGFSAPVLGMASTSNEFSPLTVDVRQVDWHGRFTAGSDFEVYTARTLPGRYWNRIAFVNEPTGHLTQEFTLERRGADVRMHSGGNIIASDDEWTSPVYSRVGPDGAVWLVDWYAFIIQHNPTPPGWEVGRRGAYVSELRDKSHGRIYRLVPRGFDEKSSVKRDLTKATTTELVAALFDPNMLWRLHAQRLLVERGGADAVESLVKLVAESKADQVGVNAGAMHALWTLDGLGQVTWENSAVMEAVRGAMRNRAWGVRRAAIGVLPRDERSRDLILSARSLEDEDAQVRLAALLALAETPAGNNAGAAIYGAIKEEANARDRWIVDAATAAAANHADGYLAAALAEAKTSGIADRGAGQVTRRVLRHYATTAPADSVLPLLESLHGASADTWSVVLTELEQGWPADARLTLNGDRETHLRSLYGELDDQSRVRLLQLIDRWGAADRFAAERTAMIARLSASISDQAAADDQRVNSARRLIQMRDDAETAALILAAAKLAGPDGAKGLIGSLQESRRDESGAAVVASWAELTPAAREGAVTVLLGRPAWTVALLDAVEAGAVHRSALPAEQWSRLAQSNSRMISRRARDIVERAFSGDRAAVFEGLKAAASLKGDAEKGKVAFMQNCMICHKVGTLGGEVGPDLTGVAARPAEELLAEILDPNRSLESNFQLWTVELKDGRALAGRVAAESRTTVELLDLAGQRTVVDRADISVMRSSGVSIMPIGFESLGEQGLADLLTFLKSAAPH